MVSLINMQPIEYPRNALLDFSPINSAIENYQQQQNINARMGMENERLGFERERQGFARDLHPLQMGSQRLSMEATRQGIDQNRLRNPLELRQLQAGVLSAEDTLRETLNLRRDLGGGNPTPESARANTFLTPSAQPMPGVSMSPPRQAAAPAPATAPPQQAAHDFNELGPRFVRDHILSVSPEVGQARFGMLLNDPVFGPALREHGLHEMDWREAASTMAGASVTPTTQPGPAAPPQQSAVQPPTAAPAAAPAQPPAQMSEQERTARRMIASGLPQYVTQGRAMLEALNKLHITEVGGRLVATDGQGRARVVYDPSTSPDVGTVNNISGGLAHLAGIPGRFGGDDGVFANAVGPFQGDPTDYSGLSSITPSAIAQGVARAFGSMASAGSDQAPAEVRRAIEGGTNTLASVLKPLIRKPGEGAWSDRDQAVLNTIVGNLSQASTVQQYNRELENVRQRINQNFNLNLPPIPGVSHNPKNANPATVVQSAQSPQSAPPTQASQPPAHIANDAEYNTLPSGARFIGPDGRTRIKP